MIDGDTAASLGSNIIFLGLIVAALWGASDFVGGVAARKAPALLVVATAHGLSMLGLVALAIAVGAHSPSEHTVVWAIANGISGGLALILFYQALSTGEMGMTAALAGLLTAVVPVTFSWMTEGRPKSTQVLGFVIAAIAIYLIAYEPHQKARRKELGLTVLAGLGFGTFLITSKFAAQGALLWALAISRITSASLAATILVALHMGRRSPSATGKPATELGKYLRAILWLAVGSGILESTGNLLYMKATLTGRLDVVSVLSSLYPAGTILLAVWLLKERATRAKTIGMVLAMAAVVMIAL